MLLLCVDVAAVAVAAAAAALQNWLLLADCSWQLLPSPHSGRPLHLSHSAGWCNPFFFLFLFFFFWIFAFCISLDIAQ